MGRIGKGYRMTLDQLVARTDKQVTVRVAEHVDQRTWFMISRAVGAYERAALEKISNAGVSDSYEYGTSIYKILVGVFPALTVESFEEATGLRVEEECTEGYSCCGYCSDCDTHHDDYDGPTNDKCDMGHCHDCRHRCEDS